MTGEMGWNEIKRENFPSFFRLADKIRRHLKVSAAVKPFDQYQGPYIAVDFNSEGISDGRELGSWSISVWGTEYRNKWFIEYDINDEFVGFTVPENKVYTVLRAIKKKEIKTIPYKYFTPYA